MIQKGYKRVTKTALSIILIFMMTFFVVLKKELILKKNSNLFHLNNCETFWCKFFIPTIS